MGPAAPRLDGSGPGGELTAAGSGRITESGHARGWSRTYVRTARFDHAGRGVAIALPSDPTWLGPAPELGGELTFGRRGLPSSATAPTPRDAARVLFDLGLGPRGPPPARPARRAPAGQLNLDFTG